MPRRRSVTRQDKNHGEVICALRDRCGGYNRDKELPHHYAHIKGLRVCAYDTHGVGNGFPDWEIWVSWLCVQMEVKQERPQTTAKGTQGRHSEIMSDDQYYRAQLESSELLYRLHHSSIVPIVWDRNQIYEWISLMADFVLYCEGLAEGSQELIRLFFPKAAQREELHT